MPHVVPPVRHYPRTDFTRQEIASMLRACQRWRPHIDLAVPSCECDGCAAMAPRLTARPKRAVRAPSQPWEPRPARRR